MFIGGFNASGFRTIEQNMPLTVMKIGGSSIASVDLIKKAVGHIKAITEQGNKVVVVVSAMGNHTNELTNTALQISPQPDLREMDML